MKALVHLTPDPEGQKGVYENAYNVEVPFPDGEGHLEIVIKEGELMVIDHTDADEPEIVDSWILEERVNG